MAEGVAGGDATGAQAQRDVTASSDDEGNAATGAETSGAVQEAQSSADAVAAEGTMKAQETNGAANEHMGMYDGKKDADTAERVTTRSQRQGIQAAGPPQDHAAAVLDQLGSDDEDEDEDDANERVSKRKRGDRDDDFLNDAGVSKRDRKEARREVDMSDLPQAQEGEPEPDVGDGEEDPAALGRTGKRRGKRKGKKNKKSEEELRIEVENLVAQMQVAVDKDSKAAKAGKPALSRMHLLKQVAESLRRQDLQMLLVDPSLGVLDAIKRWLSPLEGYRLPNEKIVIELLDCLGRLPIDLDDGQVKEQLKRTGLGKMVAFYAKLPNQKQEISRLASAVENRWTRQLYRLEERYRPDREDVDPPALEQGRRRSLHSAGPSEGGDIGEENDDDVDRSAYRYIARQPKEASMDYARRPAPALPPERLQAKRAQAAQAKSNKPLQKLKQKGKEQRMDNANLTAVEVSVQGNNVYG